MARTKYAVMVEGYFDVGQALQAGIGNVVASSGTALTAAQARLLKRFATKIVLSFDPDAAGQGAAARTSELLVSEGFQVNVAMMPAGEDPDVFIRRHGGAAYVQRLRESRPYLEYLLERTGAELDLSRDEGRREFLTRMLAVAARIPDAAARDQFADRLAHRARITEEVVRAEIRKAAVKREVAPEVLSRQVATLGRVKPAERGLLWALIRDPEAGFAALRELDAADLDGLATGPIIEQARSLQGWPIDSLPKTLIERLNDGEAGLLQEIGRQTHPPADAVECVRALKRLRYVRERTEVQREIDRLQEQGAAGHADEIVALWHRKKALLQRIEALTESADEGGMDRIDGSVAR
jgi:DNA primase